MSDANVKPEQHRPFEPSPLTLPPARLRERTADDLEIDIDDSVHELPLDDSERLHEDTAPLRD